MARLGFNWYPQDWWTSDAFADLDPIVRYVYIEILSLLYMKEDLKWKATPKRIKSKWGVGLDEEAFESLKEQFIIDEEGFWSSDKVDKRVNSKSAEASRANGHLGGRPPKKETQEKPKNNLDETQQEPTETPLNNPNINPNTNLNSKKKEKEKESKKLYGAAQAAALSKIDLEIPPHVKRNLHTWLQFRKEIGKPLSKTSIEANIKAWKNESELKVAQAIKKSIENGWRGIFLDKIDEHGNEINSKGRLQGGQNGFTSETMQLVRATLDP